MNSIEEILSNIKDYVAEEMSSFSLDGEEYSGYSDYTFIWELSYNKSPDRAQGGATGNLDTNYSVFFTPHATITYSLMTINDYRRFKQQFNSKRQFMAKLYDIEYDRVITEQMYIATPKEPKLRFVTNDDNTVSIIGVDNYVIELTGTDNLSNGKITGINNDNN